MRTLVFDLDGTLVDTISDLAAALNRLLAARLLPGLAEHEVRGMVGDGAGALVRRAFAASGRIAEPADIDAFTADYTARVAEASEPYPAVGPTLAMLAGDGWRLAICTNKPEPAARRLLRALGLVDHFAAIGGGESFPVRKPHPGHLLATIAAAGGSPEESVMVGDHANDMRAASGAGVKAIHAGWGYGDADVAALASASAARIEMVPELAVALLG